MTWEQTAFQLQVHWVYGLVVTAQAERWWLQSLSWCGRMVNPDLSVFPEIRCTEQTLPSDFDFFTHYKQGRHMQGFRMIEEILVRIYKHSTTSELSLERNCWSMRTLFNVYSSRPLTELSGQNFIVFKVPSTQVSWYIPSSSKLQKVVVLGVQSFCFLPEKENCYIRVVTLSQSLLLQS